MTWIMFIKQGFDCHQFGHEAFPGGIVDVDLVQKIGKMLPGNILGSGDTSSELAFCFDNLLFPHLDSSSKCGFARFIVTKRK